MNKHSPSVSSLRRNSRTTALSQRQELDELRARLREALRQNRCLEDSVLELLENLGNPALYLDKQLNPQFSTRSAKKLLGLGARRSARGSHNTVFSKRDDSILEDSAKALRTATPVDRTVELGTSSYRRRVIPYGRTSSGANGVVVIYLAAKQISRTTAEALKQQIHLANAARSRLFSNMGHDLRQPLQSLVLIHSLLERTVEDERAQKLLTRSAEILSSMTAMVNSLIGRSAIEDYSDTRNVIVFPVNEILQRLEREFLPHAQVAGLELRIVPSSHTIESDPVLLEQIVRNLVTNALTYTKKGKVLLGCRRRGNSLTIEVWDTGIGLHPAKLDTILGELQKLEAAEDASGSPGLGLGLFIVKRLARLLGHRVDLRSTHGKGAVFAIETRLANAIDLSLKASARPEPSRSDLQSELGGSSNMAEPDVAQRPVIFVVDDDMQVREALRIVLEDDGYLVEDFESCQSFLRSYRPRQDACLLIDAYLPDMNGLELLKRLRASGECPAAVMITGKADVSTAVQAMKAGALDFIEKPIGRTELLSCVEKALSQARDSTSLNAKREAAATQLSDLTPRQRQIMELVLAGQPSKNIAADLGISQRTVENHRASIMKRTGSRSLPELARLALTAAMNVSEADPGK